MFGPKCQSCGMPLSRDEHGGGSEADGSRSAEYCSRCYAGGRLLDEQVTCAEMQARVLGKLREMKVPGFLANRFAARIPYLRRWK